MIATERLDLLTRASLEAVLRGDLEQIPNVLRVEKRRAELWGLDQPKAVEVSGLGGGPINTDVGALLLERLRQLAAQTPGDTLVIEAQEVPGQ